MAIGLLGVASLLAGVLLEWSAAIALAAVALGIEYVLSLELAGGAIDARAPVIGAGLLLMTELAFWSIELRAPIHDDPAVHASRARAVTAVLAGAALLAVPALLVTQLSFSGGVPLTLLGALAAVALLAMLLQLAWRSRRFSGLAQAGRNHQH